MSNRLTLTGDPSGECQWAEARRGVIRFGRTVRGGSLSKPLQDREIAEFSIADLSLMIEMARASRREVARSMAAALEYHKAQVATIQARKDGDA